MSADRLAHRAGGQALAAYLHGVRTDELRLTGITLWFPHRISRRTELLAELAVGLTGVAAVSRYRFGPDDPGVPVVTWSFSRCELEDLREAHSIVGELAALGDDDVFFETWSQALYLISYPTCWRTIERIAASLVRDRLTGSEVREIIEQVASEQQITFPPTERLA